MASRWQEIETYRWAQLPHREACYVVFCAGEVIYIGHTFDLRRRMQKHNFRPAYTSEFITPWGNIAGRGTIKVAYARKFGESLMIEARLIRKLKPLYNRRLKDL
jgi:excinuclease UvrABC nuclease subunit